MTGAAPPRSGGPPVGCVRLTRWWMAFDRATTRQDVRRCDALLARLAVPAPFDLDTFCEGLEDSRGRRLMITAIPGEHSVAFSMWYRGSGIDHILVTSGWPALYRIHLVLHSIGHMLFEHTGAPAVSYLVDDVLRDLDTAGTLRHLRRTVYTAREEFQAELFATRVHQRAGWWTAADGRGSASPLLLATLSGVLEHRPRHEKDPIRPHHPATPASTMRPTERDASGRG